MTEDDRWTPLGARLQRIGPRSEQPLNWLFLAGGPGLGSESLASLTTILKLPGTLWHLDLPGDGSNTTADNKASFSHWQAALVEAVDSLPHAILAGHSTGGMYALATPTLEKKIKGLVLMDSAPNADWREPFFKKAQEMALSEVENWDKIYRESPNNETLRELNLASAPYCFTPKGMAAGRELFNDLPYNFESCQWSADHFDDTYQALWIPKELPTLIFAGDQDMICPLSTFKKVKEFHRPNILIREIPEAGHFPWVENPAAVKALFHEYAERFF
ncbi:MAG TPA: alpha/beta hydrolase [Rhabdochlamydiaceae bacterium]